MRTISKKLPPVMPGAVLRTILNDANLTANASALKMRIPNNCLNAILNGKRAIPHCASRGSSAQMWMNLQAKYDLDIAASDKLAGRIEREVEALAKTA